MPRIAPSVQRPPAACVVFFADGLSQAVLKRMLAAGQLPHIDGLFARGGVEVENAIVCLPSLTYANAGHHPPLLRTPGRGAAPAITELRSPSGTPMGIRDHVGAEDRTITLTPGQTLLLYTDGVVEATGASRDQFGLGSLMSSLAQGPEEPHALVRHLAATLREHESTTPPHDDQTLVALRAV